MKLSLNNRKRIQFVVFLLGIGFTQVFFGQACSQGLNVIDLTSKSESGDASLGGGNGGTGGSGNGTNKVFDDTDQLSIRVPAICDTTKVRGSTKSGLRRLSRFELQNTFQELLTGVYIPLPEFDQYPEGEEMNAVSSFDTRHSLGQVEALARTVDKIGSSLAADNRSRFNFGGDCFTQPTITEVCWRNFFTSYGRKVFRRPLEAAEVTRMTNAVKSMPTSEAVYQAFQILFRSPDFLFHFESGTSVAEPGRVHLTDHEIANRISYGLTGFMPDAVLAAAADQGQLKTLVQIEAQARRLILTDRSKQKLMAYFAEWLEFSKIVQPNTLYQDWILRLGLSGGMPRKYRDEIEDYINYVVWQQKGTFKDLMTQRIAFPKFDGAYDGIDNGVPVKGGYSVLAGVYGGDKLSNFRAEGDRNLVPYPAPNNPGLILRAGFLAGPNFATSPIRRGAFIKRRIFCDILPSPNFTEINARLNQIGTLDPNVLPNHTITTAKTSASNCMSCHSTINPLGFALEGFDSVGKLRVREFVYDETNLYKAPISHPLLTPVANVTLGDQVTTIGSAEELVRNLSENPRVQSCMATFALRHMDRRYERLEDGCALAEMTKPLAENQPVLDMFVKAIANEDIFWRKQ